VRNGERITLKPAHVVLATGTLGVPHIPINTIPNADVFRGPILHSSAFKNGAPYGRQCVLVVGSGNSAVDICGDLVGAQSQVTLLQRAPTTVLLRGMANAYYNLHYPEGLLTEVAGFKLLAISPGFRVTRARQARADLVAAGLDLDCANEDDARRKAAMIARGFLVSEGPTRAALPRSSRRASRDIVSVSCARAQTCVMLIYVVLDLFWTRASPTSSWRTKSRSRAGPASHTSRRAVSCSRTGPRSTPTQWSSRELSGGVAWAVTNWWSQDRV
jgi:hypothetical protein